MIKSIMCCCGSGLGSSMLVRMNVEKTLQKIGVSGVSVTHSSLSDAAEFHSPDNKESLVIFCDVTDKHMDKLLFEIRQKNLDVTFKAVLTDTNKKWNIRQMLVEMRRERFEYMRRNMK